MKTRCWESLIRPYIAIEPRNKVRMSQDIEFRQATRVGAQEIGRDWLNVLGSNPSGFPANEIS
jgi:hypothetical protein